MTKEISRLALYELVWSQPRTLLTKEFGVSDVAIGKQCVKARVPVPPPGYWARLKHGKGTLRPPLPMRLPGQSETVLIGASRDHWYPLPPENLDEPLEPPAFVESIEAQVVSALKLVGRIPACKNLSNPHASVRLVLLAEEKRRENFAKNGVYSWNHPRFDAPHHQRQLRLFNSLAHALSKVFDRVVVFSQETWVQGFGHLHFLSMQIHVTGGGMTLEFQEPGDVRFKRKEEVLTTTLKVGSASSLLGQDFWADGPGKKLERQVGDIVKALLFRAEKVFRLHAQEMYEHRSERRRKFLREQEAERLEQERLRLEAIANQQKRFREGIMQLVDDRRVARDIREMVSELSVHPDLEQGTAGVFEQWKEAALRVADSLDPKKKPLTELLAGFAASAQGH